MATVGSTGAASIALAVNPVTHAIYVADIDADELRVLDGSRCNVTVRSGCGQTPVVGSVGRAPFRLAVDPTTNSIYVSELGDDALGHTVSLVDGRHCCSTKASIGVGRFPQGMVLDAPLHTLYVANQAFDDEPGSLSVVDTRHCNGRDASGCGVVWPRAATGRGSNSIALDPATHTLYTGDWGNATVSVVDGARCNALNASGCGRPPRTRAIGFLPHEIVLDRAHGTLYVATALEQKMSIVDAQTSG